jgi:hypothetical protein
MSDKTPQQIVQTHVEDVVENDEHILAGTSLSSASKFQDPRTPTPTSDSNHYATVTKGNQIEHPTEFNPPEDAAVFKTDDAEKSETTFEKKDDSTYEEEIDKDNDKNLFSILKVISDSDFSVKTISADTQDRASGRVAFSNTDFGWRTYYSNPVNNTASDAVINSRSASALINLDVNDASAAIVVPEALIPTNSVNNEAISNPNMVIPTIPDVNDTLTPTDSGVTNSSVGETILDNIDNSDINIVDPIADVNDTPIAIAGVNAVNEDGSAITGTLTSTDVDTSDTHLYSVITDGTYGTFTVTNAETGAYTYAINALNIAQGQTLIDTLTFRVTDNNGASSDANIIVTITGVNNAPVLSGLNSSVTLAENTLNAAAQIIDSNVAFTDDNANLNGGSLIISYSVGGSSQDYLSIQNQGNGAGQIGVSGSTVSYEGNAFAAITNNGNAGASLILNFNNANATSAAVDALIQAITYQNTSDNPTSSRTLSVVINDGALNSSAQTILLSISPEGDIKTLTSGSNTFITGEGSDTFVVTTPSHLGSADTIHAGAGNDILLFGNGGAFALGGVSLLGATKTGIDQINFNASSLTGTLNLSGANFVLNSDNQHILVNNGLLSMKLATPTSLSEGSVMIGGTGLVTMSGDGIVSIADGVDGNVNASTGAVYGGTGNDTITGDSSINIIHGGAGDDYIVGGTKSDTLTGGAGNDQFVYTNANQGGDIITDFNSGFDQIKFTTARTYTFDLNNSDTLTGIANQIVAQDQGDNVTRIGIDTNGNGVISGSAELHVMLSNFNASDFRPTDLNVSSLSVIGTSGADVLTFGANASPLTLSAGGGADTITTSSTNTATIYGGAGNDTITVNAGTNKIYGDANDDVFMHVYNAGATTSTIYGGSGASGSGSDGVFLSGVGVINGHWGVSSGTAYTSSDHGGGITRLAFNSADASGTIIVDDGTSITFNHVDYIDYM